MLVTIRSVFCPLDTRLTIDYFALIVLAERGVRTIADGNISGIREEDEPKWVPWGRHANSDLHS